MRALFSPSAIWSRAAFFGFAAVFSFNLNLTARELPRRFGYDLIWSHREGSLLNPRAYSYATPEALYFATPTTLYRTVDGNDWTTVASPTPGDADPGQTTYFRINQDTSPDSAIRGQTIEAFRPEDVYREEYSSLNRAVRFNGTWWTANMQSTDGISWTTSIMAPQGPPFIQFPGSRDYVRMMDAEVLTDGETLCVVSTWESYRHSNGEFSYSSTIQTMDHDGNIDTLDGSLPRDIPSQTLAFQYSTLKNGVQFSAEGAKPYNPIASTFFADDVVIVTDGTASVGTTAATNHFEVKRLFRFENATPVVALAGTNTAAIALHEDGTARRTTDGKTWTLINTSLPPGGYLESTKDRFLYVLDQRYFDSADGLSWEEVVPELPSTNATFIHGSATQLTAEDSDGNGMPDRVWLGTDPSPPKVLSEGMDLESIQWVEELGLAVLVGISTEAHPVAIDGASGRRLITHGGNRFGVIDDPQVTLPVMYPVAAGAPPFAANSAFAYANGILLTTDSGKFLDDALDWSAPHSLESVPPSAASLASIGDRILLQTPEGGVLLSDSLPSYPFSDGFLRPNGWRGSPWFGWVNTKDYPWVFQYPAGWIFVNGPDENNCWMWDYVEGWFWTSQYYWPTIWSKDRGWRVHARMMEEG